MPDSIMNEPEEWTGPLTSTVRVTEWTLNHVIDHAGKGGYALTASGRLVQVEKAEWVTNRLVTFTYCLAGDPGEYQGKIEAGQEIDLPPGLFVPSADFVQYLQVGDLAPEHFGNLYQVCQISYRGLELGSKRPYVTYSVARASDGSSAAGTLTAGRLYLTVSLCGRFDKDQRDQINALFATMDIL